MLSKSFAFITLFISLTTIGQDMKKGFSLLENGEFKKAESFFEKTLADYPSNKTALICYGRAVGLSGDPQKSLTIFNDLLEQYPDDKEVLLNKAEAFLWEKNASAAIEEYEHILLMDGNLFAALLGVANSYSMNGQYEKSYDFIIKTLDVQPKNEQAKISAKYIRLGYANQLASEEQSFSKALELVHLNLKNDVNDQESLALLANIYLIAGQYAQSDSVYSAMQDPINSILGQSVAQHLLENNEMALDLAQKAMSLKTTSPNEIIKIQTHFVSTLLWNNQLREARNHIDSLVREYPENGEFISSQAEVAMYEADFELGIEGYNKYLLQDARSFKGNLGRADAFHALGLDQKAYEYAYQTLDYYPGQKDVIGFIGRLNHQHSPRLSSAYSLGKASDGSSFKLWSQEASLSLSPVLTTKVNYTKKDFQEASSQKMTFSTSWQAGKKLKINGSYGSMTIDLLEDTQFRSDIDLTAQYRINKTQTLSLSYQNEIQDFNEQLLNQNLKTTHLSLKNAMFWKAKGIGSYTEIYKSFLSDGNSRNLLFTSLYKSFNTTPSLKAGLNYLNMSFKNQLPTYYFSPETYHQMELFTSMNYAGKKMPFSVSIDLAGGIQSLESVQQTTWRTKATIGKSIGRFDLSLAASYSSISSAQTNGFSFSEISGKVIWRISEKPIFFRKL